MKKKIVIFSIIILILFFIIFIFSISFMKKNENLQVSCMSNNTLSCYQIASNYYNQKEYIASYSWFQKAANLGSLEATYSLAVMHLLGQGVNEDKPKALSLFLKAAKKGFVPAQFDVAKMYDQGIGTVQNIQEGLKWFKLAAKNGHKDAKVLLDSLTMQIKELNKKASEGDAEAQNLLAMRYYYGQGVEQNYPKALELFLASGQKGNKIALYNAADLYEEILKNYPEAIKIYKYLADNNIALAQYRLGKIYANVDEFKNLDEAVKYLKIAEEKGITQAKDELIKIKDNQSDKKVN